MTTPLEAHAEIARVAAAADSIARLMRGRFVLDDWKLRAFIPLRKAMAEERNGNG